MPPLTGFRVLDLSRLLPGPMCTWYLQGLGASVLKVEDPHDGDYLRYVPPYGPDGMGAWFTAINAGKRSVALDLRQIGDQRALLRLLERADVLVESFRPGVMARLGLDPAMLVERFPRLIMASLSGFGQTGSWREAPGHDLDFCALAGALSMGGPARGVPTLPGLPIADIAGGALTGALAIVAALLERERGGSGTWLDLSITDGTLALLGPWLAATAAGSPPKPGDEMLTGGSARYGLYRCADGKLLALAAIEPRFWDRFQASVGRVEDTPEALAALFATRPRDEWVAMLIPACAAPVLDLREVLEHPLHRERGMFNAKGYVKPPFPWAQTDPGPAPRLGEHNEEELGGGA